LSSEIIICALLSFYCDYLQFVLLFAICCLFFGMGFDPLSALKMLCYALYFGFAIFGFLSSFAYLTPEVLVWGVIYGLMKNEGSFNFNFLSLKTLAIAIAIVSYYIYQNLLTETPGLYPYLFCAGFIGIVFLNMSHLFERLNCVFAVIVKYVVTSIKVLTLLALIVLASVVQKTSSLVDDICWWSVSGLVLTFLIRYFLLKLEDQNLKLWMEKYEYLCTTNHMTSYIKELYLKKHGKQLKASLLEKLRRLLPHRLRPTTLKAHGKLSVEEHKNFLRKHMDMSKFDVAMDEEVQLVLDTDPGVDDVRFIMSVISYVKFLRSEGKKISIRAMTLVSGNSADVNNIIMNTAARVIYETRAFELGVLHSDFKLIAGSAHQMNGLAPSPNGAGVHGKESFGSGTHSKVMKEINLIRKKFAYKPVKSDLNAYENSLKEHRTTRSNVPITEHAAAVFIYNLLKDKPQNVFIDIIAVGPLTNLGKVCAVNPEVMKNVRFFVCMGGSRLLGNVKKSAEANWINDALAVLFCLMFLHSKMTWVPLNFTHQINCIRIIECLPEGRLSSLLKTIYVHYFEALTGIIPIYTEYYQGFVGRIKKLFGIGIFILYVNDYNLRYDDDGLKEVDCEIFPNGSEIKSLPDHDSSAAIAYFFGDNVIEYKTVSINIKTSGNPDSRDEGKYPGVVIDNVNNLERDQCLYPVKMAYQPRQNLGDVVHELSVSAICYLEFVTKSLMSVFV